MDNNAYEDDNNIYDNCRVTPDIIIQQPVTSQPSNKTEPISASDSKDGCDVSSNGADRKRRDRKITEYAYSMDGDLTDREWTSGLFYSVNGKPHQRTALDNFTQAVKDCCCLPHMMCGLARRLGEPPFLPFLPGTSTALRFKVRVLGAISGSIGKDCMVTSCCWPCAVCQMYRELEDIGL